MGTYDGKAVGALESASTRPTKIRRVGNKVGGGVGKDVGNRAGSSVGLPDCKDGLVDGNLESKSDERSVGKWDGSFVGVPESD